MMWLCFDGRHESMMHTYGLSENGKSVQVEFSKAFLVACSGTLKSMMLPSGAKLACGMT